MFLIFFIMSTGTIFELILSIKGVTLPENQVILFKGFSDVLLHHKTMQELNGTIYIISKMFKQILKQ